MADFADAPRALGALRQWLTENHFAVLKDVPGGAFNQYLVVGKEAVRVAIRADRGDWDLTVSLDGGNTFWQVDQLEAYLDSHPWLGAPSSDEHKTEFVRSRLDELQTRWREDRNACAELYRLGDEWMSWRFGIPIPDGGFPRSRSSTLRQPRSD